MSRDERRAPFWACIHAPPAVHLLRASCPPLRAPWPHLPRPLHTMRPALGTRRLRLTPAPDCCARRLRLTPAPDCCARRLPASTALEPLGLALTRLDRGSSAARQASQACGQGCRHALQASCLAPCQVPRCLAPKATAAARATAAKPATAVSRAGRPPAHHWPAPLPPGCAPCRRPSSRPGASTLIAIFEQGPAKTAFFARHPHRRTGPVSRRQPPSKGPPCTRRVKRPRGLRPRLCQAAQPCHTAGRPCRPAAPLAGGHQAA